MRSLKLFAVVMLMMINLNRGEEVVDEPFHLPSQWTLFKFGDQTNPLYSGDSAKELLALCSTASKNDAKSCSQVKANTTCINDCSNVRLRALNFAKDKVRGLLGQLRNPLKIGLIWILLTCSCGAGLYLILMGHYQWVNLPWVGNWLLDDPTDGIKFRHYMWMKWIILGNSNTHWKTHMKEDSFIYSWTPLSKLPWDRPDTPEKERLDEARYENNKHREWTVEDLLASKGIQISDEVANGALEEGWEKLIKEKLNDPTSNESEMREESKDPRYQEVLEEYWHRIYQWSWERYRME